jgi:hypothetical protein
VRFLTILTLLLGLSGCNAARRAEIREAGDQAQLGAAVDTYWKAARWGDARTIGSFLIEPADRLAVARVVATPTLRVTDVTVLQTVVGVELIEPRARSKTDREERWREGTVLVKVEAYALNSDRLTVETVEQAWVRDARGWHVDTAVSPIDADRPW